MSYTTYRSLEDKVVLISGGASGIGKEFVRAFAANDARVAFLDLQEDAGRALVGALAGVRHEPLFLRCDVTRTDELKAAIEEAHQRLGPIRVLINNAANDQRQSFEQVTPEELDRTMAVNFRHVFFASQAAAFSVGGGEDFGSFASPLRDRSFRCNVESSSAITPDAIIDDNASPTTSS